MGNIVDSETEKAGEIVQRIKTRAHELHGDVLPESGGHDSAPSPHDYFDVALASCKTLTAHWYAKKFNIPLERVEAHVERDARQELHGIYKLTVTLSFHGPLDEQQRKKLAAAVERCPIHKLMTTSEVEITNVVV